MGEFIEACLHNSFPEGGRLTQRGRLSQLILVFLAIEEIFGFVINAGDVADVHARRRWSKAADGVDALDEGRSIKNTRSAGADAREQKPRNGGLVNSHAGDARADHKAAAGRFPSGTGIVDGDDVAVVVE